jgi:ABC-2 type transport system ATP-binding protein
MLDLLAGRREVLQDGQGDPRVGVAGGSYGGALTLLLAGYDRRVDAIAPQITWNDLGQALFPSSPCPAISARPQTSSRSALRRLQAVLGRGVLRPGRGGGRRPFDGDPGSGCGRFALDVCRAYQQVAASGTATPQALALLRASSPATVLDRITAPTLLVQGEADSLFPLSEGDANARGIAARGTAVKVVWYGGGHDGGLDETDRLRSLVVSGSAAI